MWGQWAFCSTWRGMRNNMRVILAAGGSGGHIFPCIALAEELEKKGVEEVCCVASSRMLDRNILSATPYRCCFLSTNPMPRGCRPLRMTVFVIKFIYDILCSMAILLRSRPACVVGFGGYSSGAMVSAARLFGIPVLIHEQNHDPGRANRILSRIADMVAVSFEGTKAFFGKCPGKVVHTGNPLRRDILSSERKRAAHELGISPDKMTVLVMGGSQGSSFLNDTVSRVADLINRKKKGAVQFIHLTGKKDHARVYEYYRSKAIPGKVCSFLDRIGDAYASSDLAVSRAGAAAVFELAYYARPMILVPYPNPMNNQRSNARVFSAAGAALLREEDHLTVEILYKDMVSLIEDSERRRSMAKAAESFRAGESGELLAKQVLELSGGASG
ncbi:MAG: undecaprenyldiphospho-muramoylpentapeptide beta-N-acetylglucosaminyltransferase [Candidatus Omnitrophica bacterium]|nr:undecaprenyldiphospho-muramoylpentapeptide beta-N-acetylglucosaminyltransferase [Candidatus Omnitrophota bacterium]